MISNVRHVLTGRWTLLAKDVEHAFFRIEQRDSWPAALINGVIAGTAVALVAWLVRSVQEGDLLLFACLGSSASAMVFAPLAKSNSLRSIILGYVLASLTCVALAPIHNQQLLPIPLQCFLAVAVPIALMRLLDAMHPAAIGSGLAFIIYDREVQALLLLLLAILGLLTIVKTLAYIYLEELTFRDFSKEFRRNYYGKEMTVTVVEEPPEEAMKEDAETPADT